MLSKERVLQPAFSPQRGSKVVNRVRPRLLLFATQKRAVPGIVMELYKGQSKYTDVSGSEKKEQANKLVCDAMLLSHGAAIKVRFGVFRPLQKTIYMPMSLEGGPESATIMYSIFKKDALLRIPITPHLPAFLCLRGASRLYFFLYTQ